MAKRQEFAKPKEEPRKKIFLAFVLDESGSMGGATEETIAGMNEQIQQVKKDFDKDNMDVNVYFVKFNGNVEAVFMNKSIGDLKEITTEDYQPGGSTALYDAVGLALTEIQSHKESKDDNASILVTVISDGQDNSSTKFNAETLSKMVKECQDSKKWTFAYLGAEMDLAEAKANTGFYAGNMASFDTLSRSGRTKAFKVNRTALSSYASAVGMSTNSFADTEFYADRNTVDSTEETAETK